MIPEQRAASILSNHVGARTAQSYDDLEKQIAAAIREAIQIEREECARIAEGSGIYGHKVSCATAENIAIQIRSRKV